MVSPSGMHCVYWAKVMSNNENNKLVALAIVGLKASVRQLVSQSVENSIKYSKF